MRYANAYKNRSNFSPMTLAINQLQVLHVNGIDSPVLMLVGGERIDILQIVRVVPSRRIVCHALWQGRHVFAKIFLGARCNDYAQRDKRGVMMLQDAHIPSPALLLDASLLDLEGRVLLLESIEGSDNAEVLYQKSAASARLQLSLSLMETLALHHRAGILQTDLYLKNFLVKDSVVYTIDGDGIRHYTALSHAQMTNNLSILISKLDLLEVEAWLSALLERYLAHNPQARIASNQVLAMASQHRQNAATTYADKKVFRTCTDVQVKADARRFFAVAREFSMLPLPLLSADYDVLMTQSELLKSGNTCTVARVQLEEIDVVIKRYNVKNLRHMFGRMWRQTRAAASWSNAHRLYQLGIPTPKPIVLLEQRFFGLRGKAYFLSEYLDAPDVAAYFAQEQDKVVRAAVVKQLVQLFYRLYLLRISHGDTKASNIKIKDGMPVLIDLDSMRQHCATYFATKAHARDLRRFMQNWKHDTSLYNAFVKSFKVIYVDHTPLKLANIVSD
jgi:tRNA A-37 threonylcarbamoyl transferase component Bud32